MAVHRSFLSLDIGERRVGVALANSIAKISNPYATLYQSDNLIDEIKKIIDDETVDILVIGLPRNLENKDTDQTRYVREFSDKLKTKIDIPVYFEDEALSSVRAKQTLDKAKLGYVKEDIDALAACYILDDFMANNVEVVNG